MGTFSQEVKGVFQVHLVFTIFSLGLAQFIYVKPKHLPCHMTAQSGREARSCALGMWAGVDTEWGQVKMYSYKMIRNLTLGKMGVAT